MAIPTSLDPFPSVCINGLRTRPSVVVAPKGRCRVLGIRFDPAGVYSLLHASPQELVDVTSICMTGSAAARPSSANAAPAPPKRRRGIRREMPSRPSSPRNDG